MDDADLRTIMELQRELEVERAARHRAERIAAQFEVESEIATELQRSILSDLPVLEWLQIDARYRSANGGSRIGGDWYDAFVMPDGRLAAVVGDVVGHDIHAAAVMGQIRSALRTVACDRGAGPAEILSRMDDLNDCLDFTSFTSVLLGQLSRDMGEYRLVWSSAGHPPPLLLLPDDECRVLAEPPGTVLGVTPNHHPADRPPEYVEKLPPGCTLLMYTDGLVETSGVPIDERIASLARFVGSRAEASLGSLCDSLIDRFAASDDDDIAILAIRVPTV